MPQNCQINWICFWFYSFYSSNGCGFEAFVTSGGTFVVAVAHKKEFLAVPLEDGPLDDELWHCIDVCHSAAKRPFGSSLLQGIQFKKFAPQAPSIPATL